MPTTSTRQSLIDDMSGMPQQVGIGLNIHQLKEELPLIVRHGIRRCQPSRRECEGGSLRRKAHCRPSKGWIDGPLAGLKLRDPVRQERVLLLREDAEHAAAELQTIEQRALPFGAHAYEGGPFKVCNERRGIHSWIGETIRKSLAANPDILMMLTGHGSDFGNQFGYPRCRRRFAAAAGRFRAVVGHPHLKGRDHPCCMTHAQSHDRGVRIIRFGIDLEKCFVVCHEGFGGRVITSLIGYQVRINITPTLKRNPSIRPLRRNDFREVSRSIHAKRQVVATDEPHLV